MRAPPVSLAAKSVIFDDTEARALFAATENSTKGGRKVKRRDEHPVGMREIIRRQAATGYDKKRGRVPAGTPQTNDSSRSCSGVPAGTRLWHGRPCPLVKPPANLRRPFGAFARGLLS